MLVLLLEMDILVLETIILPEQSLGKPVNDIFK